MPLFLLFFLHISKKSRIFAAFLVMRDTKRIFNCFMVALLSELMFVQEAYAGSQGDKVSRAQSARITQHNKPIWAKKPRKSTGLYTIHNQNIGNAISLSINATYYYGDIEMHDQAFVQGFQPQNLSIGGSMAVGYHMPISRFFDCRFSLGMGYLHGNDSVRVDYQKGSFSNIFGELNAGVEFYPLPRAGLYIFAGLGLNLSYINYDFHEKHPDLGAGSTISFVPIVPIEIGYNFDLGSSCFLGISVGIHQALMYMGRSNLDAWPLYTTSTKFQWSDGYFTIGLSFSYRWHNCESCRIAKW